MLVARTEPREGAWNKASLESTSPRVEGRPSLGCGVWRTPSTSTELFSAILVRLSEIECASFIFWASLEAFASDSDEFPVTCEFGVLGIETAAFLVSSPERRLEAIAASELGLLAAIRKPALASVGWLPGLRANEASDPVPEDDFLALFSRDSRCNAES